MSFTKYSIRSNWKFDAFGPEEIGQKFLRTIDEISKIRPPLTHWSILDQKTERWISVDKARQKIALITTHNMRRNGVEMRDPECGYALTALDDDLHSPNPNFLSLSVSAGSDWDNGANLEIGSYDLEPDASALTYSFFQAAIRVIVSIWPCEWANAYAFNMDYVGTSPAPGVPPITYSMFHMPWIAYISPPLMIGAEPPDGVMTERTPEGGLWMTAAQERLELSDPDHMTGSGIMAGFMVDRVKS